MTQCEREVDDRRRHGNRGWGGLRREDGSMYNSDSGDLTPQTNEKGDAGGARRGRDREDGGGSSTRVPPGGDQGRGTRQQWRVSRGGTDRAAYNDDRVAEDILGPVSTDGGGCGDEGTITPIENMGDSEIPAIIREGKYNTSTRQIQLQQGLECSSKDFDQEDEEDDDSDDHRLSREQEREQGIAARLAAIFEFLRRGRSSLLPPDLRVEWEARPDLGLALLPADDNHHHTGHANSTMVCNDWEVTRVGGGGKVSRARPQTDGGRNNATSGGSGVRLSSSSWIELCREGKGVGGGPLTFHNLRMALTAHTTPPGRRRKTETTQDRLERRIVDGQLRVDEMTKLLRGNERATFAENLYRRRSAAGAPCAQDGGITGGGNGEGAP